MINKFAKTIARVSIAIATLMVPVQALAACAAGDDVFLLDWNDAAAAWPSAGATSKTLIVPRTGTAIGDANSRQVTVSINITGATNRFTGVYPNVNTDITGGYGATQKSLAIKQDLDTTSESNRIRISFSRPVREVTFELFDIDASRFTGTGFVDRMTVTGFDAVANVTRTAVQARTPRPSNVTSSVTLASPDANSVSGQTNGGSDSQGIGNVRFTFASPVTYVDVFYQNGINGTPANQGMALYDVAFCAEFDPAVITAEKKVRLSGRTTGECVGSDTTMRAAIPGRCMQYVIIVRNIGGEDATKLSISDVIPPNFWFVAANLVNFDETDPAFQFLKPASGEDCTAGTCEVNLINAGLVSGGVARIRVVVRID